MLAKFAIDIRVLAIGEGKSTGIPTYVNRLSRYCLQNRPNDVTLLTDRPVDGVKASVVPRLPKLPWQQSVVPWTVWRSNISVFHGPAYTLPLWGSFAKIATIHDLGFSLRSDWVQDDTKKYLQKMVPKSIKVANVIIVPSQIVKNDVLRVFPWVSEDRIRVIELGSRFAGRQHEFENSADGFHNRPLILHVGTIEPRKNLKALVRAFELAILRDHIPHQLVLIGALGWKMGDWTDSFLFANRVTILGYVSDNELERWYNRAWLYIQPAHYEGFAIGTLDAYCLGLPIVATKTGWIASHGNQDTVWIESSNDVESIYQGLIQGILERPRRTARDSTPWSWDNVGKAHCALYDQF